MTMLYEKLESEICCTVDQTHYRALYITFMDDDNGPICIYICCITLCLLNTHSIILLILNITYMALRHVKPSITLAV